VDSNLQEFKEKYPWAASRTIAIGVSDEHPFIAGAFRCARRNHLLFRQRQFQLAYLARFEKSRRGVLKKEIEMNDRHAIALRINAAISGNTLVPERSRKRLSHRGVRQWIEGIDVGQRWEGEESGAGGLYNTNFNSSVTALKI
jgi:hypothetical protein